MKHEITDAETKLAEQIREKARELQALAIQLVNLGWDVSVLFNPKSMNWTKLGEHTAETAQINIRSHRAWSL